MFWEKKGSAFMVKIPRSSHILPAGVSVVYWLMGLTRDEKKRFPLLTVCVSAVTNAILIGCYCPVDSGWGSECSFRSATSVHLHVGDWASFLICSFRWTVGNMGKRPAQKSGCHFIHHRRGSLKMGFQMKPGLFLLCPSQLGSPRWIMEDFTFFSFVRPE